MRAFPSLFAGGDCSAWWWWRWLIFFLGYFSAMARRGPGVEGACAPWTGRGCHLQSAENRNRTTRWSWHPELMGGWSSAWCAAGGFGAHCASGTSQWNGSCWNERRRWTPCCAMFPALCPPAPDRDPWDVVNGGLRSTLDTWRRSPSCPSSSPWSFSSLTSSTASTDTATRCPGPCTNTTPMIQKASSSAERTAAPRRRPSAASCPTHRVASTLPTISPSPVISAAKSSPRPSSSGWRRAGPGLCWSSCASIRTWEPWAQSRTSSIASTTKGWDGTGKPGDLTCSRAAHGAWNVVHCHRGDDILLQLS